MLKRLILDKGIILIVRSNSFVIVEFLYFFFHKQRCRMKYLDKIVHLLDPPNSELDPSKLFSEISGTSQSAKNVSIVVTVDTLLKRKLEIRTHIHGAR